MYGEIVSPATCEIVSVYMSHIGDTLLLTQDSQPHKITELLVLINRWGGRGFNWSWAKPTATATMSECTAYTGC